MSLLTILVKRMSEQDVTLWEEAVKCTIPHGHTVLCLPPHSDYLEAYTGRRVLEHGAGSFTRLS